jgi:hypothetical protein
MWISLNRGMPVSVDKGHCEAGLPAFELTSGGGNGQERADAGDKANAQDAHGEILLLGD